MGSGGGAAGHCRHKIDGCCLILRAWHKPYWLPRPSGGLKDRVEKDIEWVDFLKDWILFQCQFCSRTNHCFDRELMKDCCVRCEIQIAFFFNFLIFLFNTFIVVFLIIIFFSVLFWHLRFNWELKHFLFFVFKPWFYCSSFTQFGCSILLWLGFFSLVEFISWLLFCLFFSFP